MLAAVTGDPARHQRSEQEGRAVQERVDRVYHFAAGSPSYGNGRVPGRVVRVEAALEPV